MKIQVQFILALLLGISFTSCQKNMPLADFTVDNELLIYDNVDFNNISTDGDSFLWDFGDGSTGATENPSHKYDTPGDYSVTVTATNSRGSNSQTKTIQVRLLPEGDYNITKVFFNSFNTNNALLIGDFTSTTGVAINPSDGQMHTMSFTSSLTVSDYQLLYETSIMTAGGSTFGIPPVIIEADTKIMEGTRQGNTYVISDDRFVFTLNK